MLTSGKMVGFIATTDYEKSRAFYEGKLGFEFISLDQFALVMRAGDHKIRISKVPGFTPFQGTVLGWEVRDIEAVVTWLRDRGVSDRKVSLRTGQGAWDLDRTFRRQGGMVQGSGRQCPFRQLPSLKSAKE